MNRRSVRSRIVGRGTLPQPLEVLEPRSLLSSISPIAAPLAELANLAGEVVSADLDGDGRDEVVARTLFAAGGGNVRLLLARPGVAGRGVTSGFRVVVSMGRADLNGDGRDELVVMGNDGFSAANALRIFTLNANGRLAALGAGPTEIAREFETGDLDGDRRMEIVGATADGRRLVIHQWSAAGSLLLAGQVAIDRPPPRAPLIAIADIDGDRRNDLVIAERQTAAASRVILYRNRGMLAFEPSTLYTLPQGPIASMMAGDVDGDGRTDIVIGARPPAATVGPGEWRGVGVLRGPAYGSVNQSWTASWPYLRRMDRPGFDGVPPFIDEFSPYGDVRLTILAIDDMDRDGDNDIVFFSQVEVSSRPLDFFAELVQTPGAIRVLSNTSPARRPGDLGAPMSFSDGRDAANIGGIRYFAGEFFEGTTYSAIVANTDGIGGPDLVIMDNTSLRLAVNSPRDKGPAGGLLGWSKNTPAVGTQVTFWLSETFGAGWMNGIAGAGGSRITSVEFFFDSDGSGGLSRGDQRLGVDSDGRDGWRIKTMVPESWVGVRGRPIARITDDEGERRVSAVPFEVIFAQRPPFTVDIPFYGHPPQIGRGDTFRVSVLGIDRNVYPTVRFYLDTDRSGEWSGGDLFLGQAAMSTNWSILVDARSEWCVGARLRLFAVGVSNSGEGEEIDFIPIRVRPFFQEDC